MREEDAGIDKRSEGERERDVARNGTAQLKLRSIIEYKLYGFVNEQQTLFVC